MTTYPLRNAVSSMYDKKLDSKRQGKKHYWVKIRKLYASPCHVLNLSEKPALQNGSIASPELWVELYLLWSGILHFLINFPRQHCILYKQVYKKLHRRHLKSTPWLVLRKVVFWHGREFTEKSQHLVEKVLLCWCAIRCNFHFVS